MKISDAQINGLKLIKSLLPSDVRVQVSGLPADGKANVMLVEDNLLVMASVPANPMIVAIKFGQPGEVGSKGQAKVELDGLADINYSYQKAVELARQLPGYQHIHSVKELVAAA